jgi:signal transduction histidine kinase
VALLKKEQNVKEEFARQLLASQELERKRLATELHDGLGQELLIIKNKALLGIQSGELSEQKRFLEEISDTVTESLDAASEMAYNLHPFQLDRLGLTKAIHALVRRAETSSPIGFSHFIDNIDGVLPKAHEINLYRILQESLNNILKHSDATEVAVSLQHSEHVISIAVQDNGKGFDVEEKRRLREHGLGLAGLYERARIIGGILNIHSRQGGGTHLSLEIFVKGQ